MRRRVLFCSQSAHPEGGLEVWLHEFAPFLEARGWEVFVALARGVRFHDPDRYRAAHPALRTIEVDGRAGTRETRVTALRRTIAEVRPDIVVPINIADALEAVAREKLDGRETRLLVMLRAQQPHGELEDIRRFRDFIDIAVGGNRLLRALIVAWATFPEERVRYIPPGSRRRTTSRHSPKPPDRIRIAYVGRLEERDKRVLDLIETANELDRLGVRYELVVAGDGPARGALERGLAGRARMLGALAVDDLYGTVYPEVDALLLFSSAEAGPQVVWQAMHYGVVPVTSEYRGLRAEGALREGETALLFPVGDVQRAAQQVARMAADDGLLAQLSKNAETAVDPEYLLDHSFERWRRVFEECLAMPMVVGSELPAVARRPSGMLERIGLPSALASAVRRLAGRQPDPREPGDEWPHHHGIDAETAARIDALAEKLDQRSAAL